MECAYEKNIRPILDTFDKIREILRFEKIELPKIVVVGDQSSGKSSVLESITGVSLPRGENTVTRCPIVLQMRNVNSPEEEYGIVREEGNDDRKEETIPLKDLSEKISQVQIRLIEKLNVEVTDIPIYVYVRKIGAPDLTLYDLPGITYKNENLTQKIRDIYAKYTNGEETIILLVIPANSDLTTSEAISLIRKNNNYQDRTIAIITKIDLAVIQEKNLHKKIMNNELELKYYPILVRNRTQEELEKNQDFSSIRQKEIELINSSDLNQLPKESKGTDQLIWRLIKIQKEKLLNSKFQIKEKILNKINILETDYLDLPIPVDTLNEKINRFRNCLSILTNKFTNLVNGMELEESKINYNIGSRIRESLEKFSKNLMKNQTRFFTEEFHKEIKIMILEAQALKLPNFQNTSSFHLIMSKEISSVNNLADKLLDDCKNYMTDVLIYLCNKAFSSYPDLVKAIILELRQSINSQVNEIKFLKKELILCEMDGEWTTNPYYMDLISKINYRINEKKAYLQSEQSKPVNSSNKASTSSIPVSLSQEPYEFNDVKIASSEFFPDYLILSNKNEELSVINIQISCFAYWKIFEKRFSDTYQIIILRKLVYFYTKDLGIIIEKKFSPGICKTNYITEEISITRRRNEIEESLKRLNQAFDELNTML